MGQASLAGLMTTSAVLTVTRPKPWAAFTACRVLHRVSLGAALAPCVRVKGVGDLVQRRQRRGFLEFLDSGWPHRTRDIAAGGCLVVGWSGFLAMLRSPSDRGV